MTTLTSPPHPLTQALGWTLLHFIWQGALVAILLLCLLTLLSNKSPQSRYITACSALLMMIVLPALTFARLITTSHSASYAIRVNLVEIDPLANLHNGIGPSAPLLYRITQTLDHSMPWLLPIWFAGVLLLLCRLSMGLIVAGRMKSAATQTPSSNLHRIFHQLARRLGVTHTVKLMHSARVQVPTVIGWLRPVVLIPLGCLAGLSPTQVEAILAHELAHIRRHDYLVSVLQFIVEALLFYHPAVWWVSRQIRKEREHCCDDLAVRIGGNALTYARALSFLEEQRSSPPIVALGANGGVLAMRIKRILGSKQTPAVSQPTALVLLTAVVLTVGLCIGTIARAQPSAQQPSTQQPAAPTTRQQFTQTTTTPQSPISTPGSQPPTHRPTTRKVAYRTPAHTTDTTSPLTQTNQQEDPKLVPKRIGKGVSAPTILYAPIPNYTEPAKQNRIAGAVLLNLWVDEQGKPSHVHLVHGIDQGLDEKAIEAVKQYKFKPAMEDNKPVLVQLNIEVNFKLF